VFLMVKIECFNLKCPNNFQSICKADKIKIVNLANIPSCTVFAELIEPLNDAKEIASKMQVIEKIFS